MARILRNDTNTVGTTRKDGRGQVCSEIYDSEQAESENNVQMYNLCMCTQAWWKMDKLNLCTGYARDGSYHDCHDPY